MPKNEYLTVSEVANTLRCSKEKVRDMCKKGTIGATKPNGARSYLIPRVSLDVYLRIRR